MCPNEDPQMELPLDERYRRAQQYELELQPPTATQPQTYVQEKTCNNAGYCYCPKCNPR